MGVALQGLFLVQVFRDDEFTDLEVRAVADHIGPAAAAVAGKRAPVLDQHPGPGDRQVVLGIGGPLEIGAAMGDRPVERLYEWRQNLAHRKTLLPQPYLYKINWGRMSRRGKSGRWKLEARGYKTRCNELLAAKGSL